MDRTTKEALMPVLAQALRDAFRLTHVIGDRASIRPWTGEVPGSGP